MAGCAILGRARNTQNWLRWGLILDLFPMKVVNIKIVGIGKE